MTWEGQPERVTASYLKCLYSPSSILSTARHAKSRRNLGGPSPNPKYSLVTDSEPVP